MEVLQHKSSRDTESEESVSDVVSRAWAGLIMAKEALYWGALSGLQPPRNVMGVTCGSSEYDESE